MTNNCPFHNIPLKTREDAAITTIKPGMTILICNKPYYVTPNDPLVGADYVTDVKTVEYCPQCEDETQEDCECVSGRAKA